MSLTFCTTFLLFLENIFTQQPSYYGDLEKTVPTVLQVKSAFQTLKANSRRTYSIYVDLNLYRHSWFSPSPWGVWNHPGKMWPPLWRSHCRGADEAKHRKTAHSLDHESAGQIKPIDVKRWMFVWMLCMVGTDIQSAAFLKGKKDNLCITDKGGT